MVPEQQQRILGYFIEEAKDHLNTIEQGLLNLQATIVNPEMANEVFRAAHSVKGGAAMLGIESMQRTAHRMEDYFKLLKESPIKVDRALESMFLRVFDALQELLEQLQGPFGLTEDKAQSIMADVEPVFQQLQGHLEQLVADADANAVLEEVAPVAIAAAPASPQPVEESALKLVFSSDVSAALREMLARFKQADSDDSRSALEACCQMLERFGEQFNLPNWMNLVKHARWAVCDRDNDYRTLAPVLIKEIKKAQDLVLSGQEREIVLSQQLQTLAAQPESIHETDSLDDLFADDALFTTTEPLDPSASVGIDELELDSSLGLGSLEPVPTDDGISIDDLLNDAATTPSGPEVGAAELTSLADLFEAGGDGLDSDWQEEEVPITESTSAAESLDIDVAPDFEDLLNDDSSAIENSLSDFESGNELADLFDDTDSSDTGVDSADGVLSDALDLSGNTDSSSLDGLFDNAPVAETLADADDLFDDLEPVATESEDLNLEAFNSLNELASSVPADNNLADSDLSFDDTALSLESTPEATTTSVTDSFFGEVEEIAAGDVAKESEFDDFFSIDETVAESPPQPAAESLTDDLWSTDDDITPTEQDSLSDDLWADDNQGQSIAAASGDVTTDMASSATVGAQDVSELALDDVWASVEEIDLVEDGDGDGSDSSMPEAEVELSEANLDDLFGGDDIAESDASQADDLFGSNDIAELDTSQTDDLFGGDDIAESDASPTDDLFGGDDIAELDTSQTNDLFGGDDIAESDTSPTDDLSLDNGLDGLFDSDVVDTMLETSQLDPELPALDEGLEALPDPELPALDEGFGGELFSSEPDSDIGDLFDSVIPDEATGDVAFADNPLGDLDLDAAANLPDVTDVSEDISALHGDSDGEAVVNILNEPPSNGLEFDLLDLDSEGIVTGFATDDDNLNIGDGDSLAESLDDDLLSNLTPEATSVNELSDLDVADDVSADLDLEVSFNAAEDSSEDSSNDESADLEAFLDAPSSELDLPSSTQDLEPLDSLLSELPAEIGLGIAPPAASDIALSGDTTLSNDEFGDLEALLDSPSAAASSPVAPAPDVEDEFGDLEALLQDADQTLAPATASSTSSYRPPASRLSSRRIVTDQTMRVSVSHLDNLSNLVGELVVNRNTLEQDQDRLRQFLDNLLFQVQQLNDVGQRMRDLYERSLLESSLMSSRQPYQMAAAGTPVESDLTDHATGESFDALEMDRFTGFHTLSQEMIELIVRVRESAADIAYTVESSDQVTRQFRQVTNQLQEGLNKARMVPFAQASSRLPRAVRDISVKCGKEARLVVEGRDILIDKMILEQLYDPMTHLVNNAITHGVETPEERRSAGKSAEGVITVRAFYQGNQTVISVGDDGAGIDPNVVKQKALQKGLINQSDVQTMTVLDVYDLLFHPGFSTRDQADDFAGRGFGMDVVRTSLADIRGNITIDSELGRGTNFTIRLPLTLSISKALSCISNQARIAFPMDGVEDMFDVSRERIQKNDQGQDCILWRDTLLPFQNLSDLLSFNRTLGRGRVYGGNQDENMISIVVLRSANSFIALEVDQVMGEQEIVIKQLEGPVPKPTGIAGATVLGDGRVMPIADVLELIDLALGRVRRDPTAAVWSQVDEAPPQEEIAKVKSEPTVLIVDDSITVRELLSMSFNKVGYRVEQARDGQEAWEKLRSGLPCDLVFCDIEMPRMDGLELLSRLQKDDELQQIPIAMLTSRGADRHRQMAVDLGASGYFTKPYLEEALLDAANKMLHGEKLV